MSLSVPDLPDDVDSLTAALAYAAAGFYVAPVARGTKNPGSVLGASWPSRTTRDPRDIAALWAGTDHGVALHAGRSGAVVLDVDHPDEVPAVLSDSFSTSPPPMQSTRPDDPRRGHYLYAMPAGRDIGNGNGNLGKAWGDVRGRNGVIVVAPSAHPNGGAYAWRKTGPVPVLPPHLADLLPDGAPTAAVATDEQVVAFLRAHTTRQRPQLLQAVLGKLDAALEARASRHNSTVEALCWAMREARAGLYTATEAAAAIQARFAAAKPEATNGEWAGMLAWAISHANLADPDDIRRATNDRAPDVDAWLEHMPPTSAPAEEAAIDAPTDDETEQALQFAAAFSDEVTREAYRLKVREAAARTVRRENEGATTKPALVGLADFLAVHDPEIAYRVADLWPIGGRIVTAAQFKTGKTSLMGNLVGAIADGTPFLSKYETLQGTVAIIDNELDERTLRRWLRDQGIRNTQNVRLVSLRGRVSTFDLLDPQTRAEWAQALAGCDVIILDCLRPVLDALGLSEDKDAGRFLVTFDALIHQSGASEAVVVHHMGHSGERSRGDSRIVDWPDATWKLVREDTDDPASPRYFSAFGRDVDVPEARLHFDPVTRHLTIGTGNRKDAASDQVVEPLLDLLRQNPDGLSGRQIETALTTAGYTQASIRAAIKRAQNAGQTIQTPGPKRSILHFINPSASSALLVRQRTKGECVSAELVTHTHTHRSTDDEPSPSATHNAHDIADALADLSDIATLPGRCPTCAHHIDTQGHANDCTERHTA